MEFVAEREYQHMGETAGAADHDRDLVAECARRLDALWRYDQYVANADGKADLQAFWRTLRSQDERHVRRLKELIASEIRSGCF